MATNSPRVKVRLKRIVLGGLTVVLLAIAWTIYQFYEKYSEIREQISIQARFPPLRKADGVYQYHIWLEGSDKTTMLHRVEVNLSREPAYAKTISVSTTGIGWKPYSSNGIKGGMKGMPEDDVYLKYEMNGRTIAKSWSLVELSVEVGFRFTQFWKDFYPTMNFSFDVPGPYNRTGERSVNRKVKWTSNDGMEPESEWKTIAEN